MTEGNVMQALVDALTPHLKAQEDSKRYTPHGLPQ